MADDPLYNIFRYALQDEQGLFLGNDVGLYADTLVNEAFENTNEASQLLGAEAIVVYNVWMYLAHELSQTLRNCKNRSITDMDGIHSIDEAVAYWIGDGQVTGDREQGHLLYALAEQMGERFGLDETAGESRTNTNILRLFNQAKFELSFPTACSDDLGTHPRLFQIVNNIVSWMTVPLVQGLIHNLYENDKDRVKLYGRAVWPLVAGCSNSTFTALKDKLFNADYNVIEVDDIVARIENTYGCLGFTCDDMGVHEKQTKQTCTDISVLTPVAGYVPQSDVRAVSCFVVSKLLRRDRLSHLRCRVRSLDTVCHDRLGYSPEQHSHGDGCLRCRGRLVHEWKARRRGRRERSSDHESFPAGHDITTLCSPSIRFLQPLL
jgi:hypothetical protein